MEHANTPVARVNHFFQLHHRRLRGKFRMATIDSHWYRIRAALYARYRKVHMLTDRYGEVIVGYHAECMACGCAGPLRPACKTEEAAANQWNAQLPRGYNPINGG